MALTLSGVILAAVIWVAYKILRIGHRESYLPPGPPTKPILGNILDFPTGHPWYKLTEYARKYGDVYSLKVGTATFVVLSSQAAIRDIVEKNSSIVSDRPPSHIQQEITGGNHIGAARYGERWRRLRRCAREILTAQACRKHLKIQQAEATQLLHDLIIKPEDFYDSVRRYSSSAILSVLYGKRAPQFTTPEVTDFFEAEHHWQAINELGAHPPIDLIPILKKVPERWASWKTEIKLTKLLQQNLYFGLLEKVERRMEQGITNGCFMESVIEKAPGIGLDRNATGQLGGTLIEGGSDTTSAFILTLILALVNAPEAQRLAQEEIDRIIGAERAPLLDDIDRLPYAQALIKEVHRWRPVAPLALPHASTEDITYREWLLPKGTAFFMNVWGIFHDPEVFSEPSEFNPGRWLKEDMATDRSYDLVFGGARRICPGMHLAKNSVNMNVINLLWAFNFKKSRDPATGQDKVYDTHDFVRGILTAPSPFNCVIEPRSAHHVDIIKRDYYDAIPTFEMFEHELDPSDQEFVTRTRQELKDEMRL